MANIHIYHSRWNIHARTSSRILGRCREIVLGERRNNKSSISPAHFRGHVGGRSLSRSITIVAEPHNLITAEVRRHPLSRGRLTSQTGMEASQQIAPGTHGRRSFDGHRVSWIPNTYARFHPISRESRGDATEMHYAIFVPRDQLFRDTLVSGATSIIVGFMQRQL